MKDAAPNSLENIKHKLLSSLEDGYEVPGHAPLWYYWELCPESTGMG